MYNTATLIQKDPASADDRVRLVIQFTGNADEPAKDLEFYVGGNTQLTDIRRWCIEQASRLDGRKNVADNLTVGQTVNLNPLPPTAGSAKQAWQAKVSKAKQYIGLGLTGGALSALNTLILDINNSYQVGFLD